jgi:aryl-alcohol dehydrogenase-like predicted oxidoreductase
VCTPHVAANNLIDRLIVTSRMPVFCAFVARLLHGDRRIERNFRRGVAMEFSRLGCSGLLASRLSIGTMTFGTQMDEHAAQRLLDEAYAAGVNFFDTAEIYPAPASVDTHGISEVILGRWLKGKSRDSVIISTKLAGASDSDKSPRLPWLRGGLTVVDRFQVSAACEASLRRLGVDYIDIYQPHWPDRKTPIEIQLDAVSRLIDQGKIRYFGLSNETAWGITTFCCASSDVRTRPAAAQNAYNLLQRRVEYGVAEACENEEIGFIAYSPLAMGVLTGKYTDGKRPQQARLAKFDRYGQMYLQERMLAIGDAYVAVAKKHALDPVEMAYAWVRHQPFVASTLSSFSKVEQLRVFLRSSEIRLDSTVMAELDAVRQTHDARWNMLG